MAKGPRGANATIDFYMASWAQDSSLEAKKKIVVDLETDIVFLMSTKMALAQHRASAKNPNKGHSDVDTHWEPYTKETVTGGEATPVPPLDDSKAIP